jgi:hypothetical protein
MIKTISGWIKSGKNTVLKNVYLIKFKTEKL